METKRNEFISSNRRLVIYIIITIVVAIISVSVILNSKTKESDAKALEQKKQNLTNSIVSVTNKMYDLCNEVFQLNSRIENGKIENTLTGMISELKRINDENLKVGSSISAIDISAIDNEYRNVQELKNINEKLSAAINKMIRGLSNTDEQAFKDGALDIKDLTGGLQDLLKRH